VLCSLGTFPLQVRHNPLDGQLKPGEEPC
jgi:hypothetical protein